MPTRIFLKDFFSTNKFPVDFDLDRASTDAATNIAGKTVGFYAHLGSERVGLFAAGEELFLLVNNDVFKAPSEKSDISYSRQQDACEIKIRFGGRDHVFRYYNTSGSTSTPFYAEDEEDSDFGIWLQNVLRSDERRRILKESWRKGIGE